MGERDTCSTAATASLMGCLADPGAQLRDYTTESLVPS
jgi:hypothetical protein